VKAKIEAANAGIAKWRRLARAMSNALGESKGTDDPPPTAEAVVPAPPLPAEESKPVEWATTVPADTPLVPRPTSNEPPPGAGGAVVAGGDVDLVIIGPGSPQHAHVDCIMLCRKSDRETSSPRPQIDPRRGRVGGLRRPAG
jgi:hypothetical protein